MVVWLHSTFILLFIWRTRKTYPGFGYWVLQSAGITLGHQLLTLYGSAPAFVSVLTGNGLIFISVLLALKGVRIFIGKVHLHAGYWIAFAAVESGLAWFTYAIPNLGFRVFLASLFIGTVSINLAWELLFSAPVELRVSSRFTGVVIIAYGVLLIFRGFATLIWIPLTTNFSPNIIQVALFIASISVSLLSAFGFIIMNSQRLENEIKFTGDKLQESLNELEHKMAEIKTLSGLLPICSSCKKIRDDKGYWNQIEVYIRDHSDADFSHGICPDCLRKFFPGTGKDKE